MQKLINLVAACGIIVAAMSTAYAIPVPDPTTVALIVLGVWGLIMARRRESLRARLEATERSHTKEEPGLPRSNSVTEKELPADREPNAS